MLDENLVGEEFKGNADVFGARQGRHQVKVFNVQCHEVGIVRHDRLEQDFHGGQCRGVGFGGAVIVDAVTARL